MFAYRLETALDFLDGLPADARQKTEAVALKTSHRAAKLRKGLAKNLPLGVSK
jgi:hypothetical protein